MRISALPRNPLHLTVLLAAVAFAAAPAAMAQGGALDPRIRWRVPVPGRAVTNYVATAPDGTVYVNSDAWLKAFDPSGNLQWEIANTSLREARPINVRADGSLDPIARWVTVGVTVLAILALPQSAYWRF